LKPAAIGVDHMACFVCGNVRITPTPETRSTVFNVECRLCGRYQISFVLAEDIEANRANFQRWLPFLSAHTKQATARGELVLLEYENYERLAAGHMNVPVADKLRRVLEHLGACSTNPGDMVSLDLDAYPLFDVAASGHMLFLLESLAESEVIRRAGPTNQLGHPQWIVTVKGWERLAPLMPGGTPGTVFVAMAFTGDMNAAYDNAIRPAVVNDCGLTITQVGRIEHNGSITDAILSGIRSAQVVIADVTHHRNGVYFEGGFGMGLGRIVVWMCRQDHFDNVHFDTSHYNHIVWQDAPDLRAKLATRLGATVSIPIRGVQSA
jgi:hypothetical protein